MRDKLVEKLGDGLGGLVEADNYEEQMRRGRTMEGYAAPHR